MIASLRLKVIVALFYSLACLNNVAASNVKGFIYSEEEELKLDGEWMFYWKQLLYTGDNALENSGFEVEMPNYWNNHKHKGYIPRSFGYATYKTTITCERNIDIALEYTGPHCAQRIYINGELIVTTGTVGTTLEEHEGLWLPGTVETHLKRGENELIIQISNFEHSKGGIYKAPIIGQPSFLLSRRNSKLFFDSFISGGLGIMGLFFLGLSIFWRNNRLFIYFGMLACLFSFWYINYGTHVFKVAFPNVSWSMSMHLTYLAFYGFSFFITLFVYEAFKKHFGKHYLITILVCYALLFSSVVFGTPNFFSSLLFYARILIFGQFLYAVVLLLNRFRLKIKGSTLGVLLVVILSLLSITALGVFFRVFPWISEVLGLLFLVTFLIFAVLMARKVGGDYRDVVKLKEEATIQKEKIQEQATKLRLLDEMKTRFFANVSHDLRSPLTLIKGNIFRIRNKDEAQAKKCEQEFKTIDENVNQLIQFTDEIRDINLLDQRTFTLSFSDVEVNSFLNGIFNMFQSFAEIRGITLVFVPASKNLVIRLDEKKVRRILNNLVSNAFKFTDDNGRIELSIDETQHGANIKLLDTGVGIAEEEQPFIFDRFYQGKRNAYRSEEGMGIGLALVKELISLHEGDVNLESEEGKGSVFSIFLPFNHNKTLDKTKDELETQSTPKVLPEDSVNIAVDFTSKKKQTEQTILLVDDHPEVRKYIASVINDSYYVIEAKNGVEAYGFLKKQKVDLVITDLMMPWMDGFELIDKMNADSELSRVKIMVVSARTTREDKLKTLNKGVNEFISKPFDEVEFNRRVANVMMGEEPSMLYDLAKKKGKYSEIEKNVLFKVNNLIMDQIDNSKLTTAVLADKLATSERNANRIIKKLTGLPPKSYIQKVRMNYAEVLLKEGKVKSLTEAGQAIGIQNTTQFAKQFEKIKGYSPFLK